MTALLHNLYRYRELLLILIARNLKIRYKNSALGFLWTLLGPLFLIIIYSIFLTILMYKTGGRVHLPSLVTGIIVWQFLAMCLGDSLLSIMGNAPLVKKTAFPRIIFPLSMIAANLVNFLLSSLILVVYLQIAGLPLGPIYWLPVILLTQLALCLGVSLFLAAMNVFFRDTEHLVSVLMLAWFFLTPVIYTVEWIPERYRALAFLNPMTGIVTGYRNVLMSGPAGPPLLMLMSFGIAWAMLVLGLAVFQKLQLRFAEEL
jgi:ABC-2 type transport system permease protein